MKKSFRIFDEDLIWLKACAVKRKSTVVEVVSEIFCVQDKFNLYFEATYGEFKSREADVPEIIKLTAQTKVISLVRDQPKWLDDALYDEEVFMENKMTAPQFIRFLVAQHKEYLADKEKILSWYRTFHPSLVEE